MIGTTFGIEKSSRPSLSRMQRGCFGKIKMVGRPDWLRGPQKTGESNKFILTLKSLTLKKERQSLPPPIRRQTNLNSSMTYHLLEKLFESWHTCLRLCNNLKKNRIDPKKRKIRSC
ncbi:hypothetical protein TNCV_1787761 [Trichonephila clavipes]|nr:hypothetical protein TNCV_1787761 [Trichonephila clavipes]